MGSNLLTQNPFAVLTFIVAPAILTNATSVLALSTINRMLRPRQRIDFSAGTVFHPTKL